MPLENSAVTEEARARFSEGVRPGEERGSARGLRRPPDMA